MVLEKFHIHIRRMKLDPYHSLMQKKKSTPNASKALRHNQKFWNSWGESGQALGDADVGEDALDTVTQQIVT